MNRLLIAAAVAALAVPAAAQVAQVAPPPPPMKPNPPMMQRPMADGVMTLAEVQAMVGQAFMRRDINRDNVLTQDEMGRAKVAMRGNRVGNPPMGTAVRTPMDPAAAFDRLDANKDGMISRDEFARGREVRIERRVEMRGPDGARMKMRRPGMRAGMGGMMGGRMLVMADTNKDGRILLVEAQAAAAQHFAMADTNRDGRVTREEMRAMHMKMHAPAGAPMRHHG